MTAASVPGPVPAVPGQRWWRGQRALVGTALSLIATTGVTTLLGLAFWLMAARLMPVSAVGYGSAAVSALTLVGTFGMAGLNTVLIGHFARRPGDASGMLIAALCASGLISAALASAFWLVVTAFAPRATPYLHSGPQAALFIIGSGLTGATLVFDEALLGLLGGSMQLWRNTAFAVAKLGALAALVMLWYDKFGTSIPAAWTVGTALSMVPVAVLLRRRGMQLFGAPQWRALWRLARASVSNTWLNNALLLPGLALPLLVTGMLSAADGGAFYVAWTVVTIMSLLSYHFTTALYAAGAADPRGLTAKLRFTLRISMLTGLVAVPLVIVCAHPLLRVFGPAYAARAAVPLEVLALGYFGSVVKHHYIALGRISGRLTRVGIFATVAAAARLGAAAAGAVTGGLTGLSLALLAVMCAEGIVAAPAVWAALRAPVPAGGDAPGPAHLPTTITEASAGQRPTRSRPVRVCYYLQTHSVPAQVARLVGVIKEGSPGSVVLISHDAAGPPLDIPRLEALPGVHVFVEPGGYGDFSHLDRYFAAVDWLDAHGVEFDWLENITGQDYPLRPIADIERTLAHSDVDGYLLYAPVFPDRTPSGADRGAAPQFQLCAARDAATRYQYKHRRFGRPTPAEQRWLRPAMALNLLQPWVRVSLGFAAIGMRRRRTVFTDGFVCYGGWFFCTLSAACVRYAREYARDNPGVVAYFRTVLAPEEVFLQTVLVNSGRFRFEPDAKRYIDLTRSRNNHSKILGVADLDPMLASGAHWARKFDPAHDAEILDMLDRQVRPGRQ
jgi:O-antigen/teichoic acid export membrane protein